MRKITLFTLAAVAGLASIGCSTTANTNATTKANGTNANANTAVVVNTNTANTGGTGVSTMNGNSAMGNTAVTRADYDRDKDRYASEAKTAGSTIGSGVNDGWLWTKAKASLAAVDDLRDSTINVDVNNEVVTLRGTVGTKEQSTAAAAAAKVDGVKSVTNNLKVNAGDSVTNQMTGGTTDGSKKPANANR